MTMDIVVNSQLPDIYVEDCKIYDDIKSLLWFGDGPYKNLSKEHIYTHDEYLIYEGIKIRIPHLSVKTIEPSLIFMNMPVQKPIDESLVPRPPYYPTYIELTPEQRWIYLKLLSNPYNANIDIGYVFIFYYGLERHLIEGDFHSAFNVILKLRNVHKNKSFHYYSGNALILSALWKGKGEYIPLFIKSLENEYEYNFSDNLLIMSYFSFNVPFLPRDIMIMAKTFLYRKMNYIKNNPDVFLKCLTEIIKEKTGMDYVDLKTFYTTDVIEKLHRANTPIYANMSMVDKEISIPILVTNMKFKGHMLMYLTLAHEKTKVELAEIRKNSKKKLIKE